MAVHVLKTVACTSFTQRKALGTRDAVPRSVGHSGHVQAAYVCLRIAAVAENNLVVFSKILLVRRPSAHVTAALCDAVVEVGL